MSEATRDFDPQTWLTRHGDYLFRFALGMLRDPRLAEDAVQDCLLAALEAQDRYSGEASERTWLTGILKHKVVDILRRCVREAPSERIEDEADVRSGQDHCFDQSGHWAAPLSDWGDPERALENRRLHKLLRDCLAAMPPRLAQIFMLREVIGRDSYEICQEMEISPTNLWTMLYRGRMNLRQCIERFWARGGTTC